MSPKLTGISHNFTTTSHNPTAAPHNLTSTSHNLSGTFHNLTATFHNLTRTFHNFTSTSHNLTVTLHNLTVTFHNLIATSHNFSEAYTLYISEFITDTTHEICFPVFILFASIKQKYNTLRLIFVRFRTYFRGSRVSAINWSHYLSAEPGSDKYMFNAQTPLTF